MTQSKSPTPPIDKSSVTKSIAVPATVSVGDFAKRLGEGPARVVSELMKNGVMATINEAIDFETAEIIAAELGYTITQEVDSDEARPSDQREPSQADPKPVERPPVIAVLGHVDHGKTSLLDAIRKVNTVGDESGGITQHIGAYQVRRGDRWMTFLDTPGHEAFHAIRAHGIKVTDVAVVVVAADDGVKTQTKEAIRLVREAGSSLIIAINKIDKPDADVNRVKQELTEAGVQPDDWGGDTPCIEVSAKTSTNLDKLLDLILLVSDIDPPTAISQGPAKGIIIESHVEIGRGSIVTVLVEEGVLRANQYLVAGSTYGKVRALENYQGERIKTAAPGTPALVLGFKSIPAFGDWFEVVESEKMARDWLNKRHREDSIKSLTKPKSVSVGDIERAVSEGQVKEIAVLLKADAQGSLESVSQAIELVGNDEVRVRIVSSGIGDITENDINTATASGAIVLGFHVSINSAVNQLAKRQGVTFNLYKVIYELLDDVREWLSALLPPETVETELGVLEILAIFKTTKDKIICGGSVISGQMESGVTVQIMRDKEVLDEVELIELRRGTDIIAGAQSGEECGLSITRRSIVPEVGDRLRLIRREIKSRSL